MVNRGKRAGVPNIGHRVCIGPNAVLIGNLTVGDDAAIGAGAVVTESIPARGVAVGNPARTISSKGSFEYVLYDGMEVDPARLESLRRRDELADKPMAGAPSKDGVSEDSALPQ